MRPKYTFGSKDHDFHVALKARVDEYFEQQGLDRHANGAMIAKTLFWIGATVLLYVAAVFGGLPGALALALCGLFGFTIVCIGFNVGHDAIHGAYSAKPWVNKALGLTFDVMGANSTNWALHHNIMHHTWTNVPKVDGDIELAPAILAYPGEPMFFNRWQQYYAWVAYSFTSLFWIFANNVLQVAQGDPRTGARFPLSHWLKVAAGVAAHVTLFLVVPTIATDYATWQVGLGFLAMHLVGGFTLAIVFQMAHLVEGVDFPTSHDGKTIESSWAAHQLRTTANFAVDSWLARLITGGLNQQVEHHLFPKICHVHYPALAPIVRETAREHGIPYHEFPTFAAAVRSHYRILKRNGRHGAAEIEAMTAGNAALPAE